MWSQVPAWFWASLASVLALGVFVAVVLDYQLRSGRWRWRYRPAHAALPVALPVLDRTLPVAKVAGLPPWEPEVHHGPGSLGTWFPRDDVPPEGEWTDKLLADLRGAPTVLDDLPGEDETGSHAGVGSGAPGAVPSRARGFDSRPVSGAGDESEACGPPAPPAPLHPIATLLGLAELYRQAGAPPSPTRLLRTTGELLDAELLAECTAFMARQDAEVAVWLASAGERWAAA